jgi:hypothetical protein
MTTTAPAHISTRAPDTRGIRTPSDPTSATTPSRVSHRPTPPPVSNTTHRYSGLATCRNLIGPARVASLRALHYHQGGAHFLAQITNTRSALTHFLDYGGIVCLWRLDTAGDVGLSYGYGPITSQQMRFERCLMHRRGSVRSVVNGHVRFQDDHGYWAFGRGYWVNLFVNGGTGDITLGTLIAHAPAFY